MPVISITQPLGRIAMAHTASVGVYLYQDPHSRVWQVGSAVTKVSFSRRLWLVILPFRSSKLAIGTCAATAGVLFSLVVSYFVLNGGVTRNPTLALQPPVQSTQFVGLSAAPYMVANANAPFVDALPLPAAPAATQLPPPLNVEEAQPTALRDNIPPSVVATVRQQAPAKPLSKEDSSLAVFNQALPAKTAESQAVKLASGPLAVQAPVRTEQSSTSVAQKIVPAAATPGGLSGDPSVLVARSSTSQAVNILAVPTAESIVITNPSSRLPMVVKVGDRLPDGATLKTVDKSNSTATNSRGETLSLR